MNRLGFCKLGSAIWTRTLTKRGRALYRLRGQSLVLEEGQDRHSVQEPLSSVSRQIQRGRALYRLRNQSLVQEEGQNIHSVQEPSPL